MKFPTTFAVALLLLAGCAQKLREKPPVYPFVAKIDSFLTQEVERLNLPGLAVAVTLNDETVYAKAFGFRNIDTKEPLTADHFFHMASVSKPFAATAVLQLSEQGKINLDEKLTAYLPYFKLADENYKKITIRQMLNHTSGMGDVADYEWDKPQYDDSAAERWVRSLEKDGMRFEPGQDWAYSNTAFDVLADVVAKVSGVPFEDYVRKNIFEPLEMTHSSFKYPDIPEDKRVTPHTGDAKVSVSNIYPYNRRHAPSSTLNSSVMEMTHWAIANLNRGKFKGKQILSPAGYDVLWSNSVNLENKPKVGLSWFLGERNGMKTIAHGGGDLGFRSFIILCPEAHLSVILASNYEGTPSQDITFGVFDILADK